MRIVALVLAFFLAFVCLDGRSFRTIATSAALAQSNERGSLPDVDDSELFLQNASRASGPQRDYSQEVEALIKRMTLEEKVGQMTQLTISMITSGQDQKIQIDPAAVGQRS